MVMPTGWFLMLQIDFPQILFGHWFQPLEQPLGDLFIAGEPEWLTTALWSVGGRRSLSTTNCLATPIQLAHLNNTKNRQKFLHYRQMLSTSLVSKFPLDLLTTTPSLSNNSNKRELIISGVTKEGVNHKTEKHSKKIRKNLVICPKVNTPWRFNTLCPCSGACTLQYNAMNWSVLG